MKYLRTMSLLLVLSFAIGALAQKPAAPPAAPAAQTATQPAPSLSGAVDREISIYEKYLVDVAEAMPEDKYNFTPESLGIKGSSYTGVRTFAQLLKHTATANYRIWATLAGEAVPENVKNAKGNGPDELKTRAEIIQFVKDSFAVGHRAAKAITAENALDPFPFFNSSQPRIFMATFGVIHDADEYGQMVEYLRMNGIVPPASRR
jgi:hypothetical protein